MHWNAMEVDRETFKRIGAVEKMEDRGFGEDLLDPEDEWVAVD